MPKLQSECPRLSTHILIVDDDHRLLHAMKSRLSQLGYHCVAFNNVTEAAAHLVVATVDLVITDLKMSGIDGAGFIRLVRSQKHVPIIVVTGQPQSAHLEFNTYDGLQIIHKPFSLDALVDGVRLAVARRESAMEESIDH